MCVSFLEDIRLKKLQKQRIGFTLIEMVLVIAIIVILAAVLYMSVTKYLDIGHKAASNVSSKNSSFSSANSKINQDFINLGY